MSGALGWDGHCAEPSGFWNVPALPPGAPNQCHTWPLGWPMYGGGHGAASERFRCLGPRGHARYSPWGWAAPGPFRKARRRVFPRPSGGDARPPSRQWSVSGVVAPLPFAVRNLEHSAKQIHILGPDRIDLFRAHSGFKNQPGYVSQEGCGFREIIPLFCVGKNPRLLVILRQELYPAHRIPRSHIGLDRKVEESLETGQLTVDLGWAKALPCLHAGAIFLCPNPS